MKYKTTGFLIFIVLGLLIVYIVISNSGVNNKSAKVEKSTQSKIIKKSSKVEAEKNLAINVALKDFGSLKEFNDRFPQIENSSSGPFTPDEHFMIPDTTPEGNSAGKERQWIGYQSRDKAQDSKITDINTGEVTAVIRAKDGATAGDIRKALLERDSNK